MVYVKTGTIRTTGMSRVFCKLFSIDFSVPEGTHLPLNPVQHQGMI
jgi:hypothetical protein